MNKQSITLLAVLVLVNCSAFAAPTNEQLYQMLLEVKAEQGRLKQEATLAKKRESDLQLELARTQDELVLAKQQLNQSFAEPEELAIKEGFFMSAGGLYVRPLIDAGGAGLTIPVSGTTVSRISFEGNELDYEPGFQVSLGYQAADNWDYGSNFKHFSAKESVTFQFQPVEVTSLTSTLAPVPSITTTTTETTFSPIAARIAYQLNFDILDFEIGKQFAMYDNLSIRLSGGLRYAALEENYQFSNSVQRTESITTSTPFISVVVPGTTSTTTSTTTTESESESESDFWGIGPRLTASPTWKPFHNNFRVFGNIGAAFLMGQYETSDVGNKEGFLTIVEAGGGIGYTLTTGLVDLDISAGYQFEHWLDSDLTDELLYRGFHGSYGTIGVKF